MFVWSRQWHPDSSALAWKLPWVEEPGGLQSMGSLRVRHDWATSLSLFIFMHWRRKWQPTPVFLPGESQGRGSLVGCRLWGLTESDTTEATWQEQCLFITSFFFLFPSGIIFVHPKELYCTLNQLWQGVVWEGLYFIFNFNRYFFWLLNSKLAAFSIFVSCHFAVFWYAWVLLRS